MTKNHIILEIQRAAGENGGKPLGRLKFFRVTGIKGTDWSGKYWARWSDALKDAGFGPNQLQQPYDDSVLLSRFAGLIRELGRVPLVTEMRMKSRVDKSFPSSTVFERFGSKQQLLARTLQYAQEHDSYSDVVPLLSAAVRSDATHGEDSAQKVVTGFVRLSDEIRASLQDWPDKLSRTSGMGTWHQDTYTTEDHSQH